MKRDWKNYNEIEDFHSDHLPDKPEDLPQGFVIILDFTGLFSSFKRAW
ncbi:MAG: hypothetical protein NZ526_01365 [Aquificaceae bacterium]|nr:hypothetical protein [Aquificaceae bacterium]